MHRITSILVRLDRLLTARHVLVASITLLSIWVVLTSIYLIRGGTIATDYAGHLIGGRMVLDGDTQFLYNLDHQRAVQRRIAGGLVGLNVFVSPPFVAWLYAPFAALPFAVGAMLWTALSLVMLAGSIRLLSPLLPRLRRVGLWWVLLIVVGTMPAILLLINGQDSALSLLLLALALRLLLAQRDGAAGIVLALGLFKPQLFLSISLLLFLQQRWRAVRAWFVGAIALTCGSVLTVGFDTAESYVLLLISDFYFEGVAQQQASELLSLGALVRSVGLGPWVPLVIGVACLCLAAFLGPHAVVPTSNPSRFLLLYSAAILAGAVVSPHLFLYDGVVLLLPALVLLQEAPGRTVRLSLALAALLTCIGAFQIGSGGVAPWTVVPMVVLLFVTRRSLIQSSRPPVTGYTQRKDSLLLRRTLDPD